MGQAHAQSIVLPNQVSIYLTYCSHLGCTLHAQSFLNSNDVLDEDASAYKVYEVGNGGGALQ